MQEPQILTFHIDGDSEELLRELFREDSRGGVLFGPVGSSPVSRVGLREWARFRDYLMEGFVTFELRASPDETGLTLEVRPMGGSRDRYLESHVRWVLGSAGYVVRARASG